MKKVLLLSLMLISFVFGESVVQRSIEIPLSDKPTMFIFDSKTCPYCEKLEKELDGILFLNDVAKKFNIYAIARDDHKIYKLFGRDVSTQELQMSYHVKATPNIVILNKSAQKMFQTHGYVSPLPLSKMMEFVLGVDSGKYKKSEWSEYLYKSNITTSKTAKPKSMQH